MRVLPYLSIRVIHLAFHDSAERIKLDSYFE
jgi:hypothetical protein